MDILCVIRIHRWKVFRARKSHGIERAQVCELCGKVRVRRRFEKKWTYFNKAGLLDQAIGGKKGRN